jgi:hypothetical protein
MIISETKINQIDSTSATKAMRNAICLGLPFILLNPKVKQSSDATLAGSENAAMYISR